jgi:hypothetical protein
MPYLLERKMKCIDIGFLKKHPELDFLDYIIIIGPFANYHFGELIELIIET